MSAVAVSCVLVSACDVASGGGGSGDGLNLKAPPHASAVRNAEGLGGATLGARDVDGYAVTSPADDEVTAQRDVKVADDVCDPVAYALSTTVVGKPTSTVVREAMGEKAAVTVVLAEYAGEQAQGAMDDLSTAVSECAGGFAVTVNGEERKVGKVVPEIAPQGADQAMALGAVVESGGLKTPVKVVVLRKGATVGYISAVPTGKGDKAFAVPAAVVDAQLAKLH
ncbi:hypothetical protein [Streptomyces acidicola]|uniref:DUF5642 domain-containing protein n=1 Tax=Streptomyces acidicola TaxID=2596892 RepID=A0A5N8X8T2_9ACTN|nr:hypothetical protein [Streptomyces acidicola]MPY54995.1 hypothetical protein [Streptomyces acidicola]